MQSEPTCSVVLYNDEKNSFQGVISALAMVCNHNLIQAEQCATLVHHTGQCYIKEKVDFESASQYKELLTELGLHVEIVKDDE